MGGSRWGRRGDEETRRRAAYAAFVLTLLLSGNAFGQGYADTTQCNAGTVTLGTPSNTHEVFVYVEHDFADEMASCTPRTDDDGNITEAEVQYVIESALETWNQQSLGLSFHFEGTVPTGYASTACSSYTPKQPALFIGFHPGCKNFDASCPTGRSVLATASEYTDDCAHILVWGDPNTYGACTSDAFNWSLDPRFGTSLKSTLVHELGHILGLGHSNDVDNNVTSGAVMRSRAPLGRIAYTYFKVASNGKQIDWLGTSYIRGGTDSVAGVQASYSKGKFRMAWKERGGGEAVNFTQNSSNYTSWSAVYERSAPGIVDPPTYLYHSHEPYPSIDGNHALVWTASDTSDN